MIPQQNNRFQLGFFTHFDDTLNQKHPLYILANKVQWQEFEDAFLPFYCQDNGRPAKPIRLMVGLLMLNISAIFLMRVLWSNGIQEPI